MMFYPRSDTPGIMNVGKSYFHSIDMLYFEEIIYDE